MDMENVKSLVGNRAVETPCNYVAKFDQAEYFFKL